MNYNLKFPKRVQKTIRRMWRIKLLVRARLRDVPESDDTLVIEAPTGAIPQIESAECGVKIGAYSYSGSTLCRVTVGRYCSIAEEVTFSPLTHPLTRLTTSPITYLPYWKTKAVFRPHATCDGPVILGHDVWIGSRVIIMGGITIGRGAIIGAGAVVTKDVPPYAIVGGIPARLIRMRFTPDQIREIEATQWWEYDLGSLKDSLDWDNLDASIKGFQTAVAAGRIRRFDDGAGQVITLKDLSPFDRRRRFVWRFGNGYAMLKLFGLWIICRLPRKGPAF